MPLEPMSESVPMQLTKRQGILAAEDAVRSDIARAKKDLERLESILAGIVNYRSQASSTGEPIYPPVREHEYQGMRAVDALESYLRGRRGMKIPLSRIAQDLVKGGANPGKSRGKNSDPERLMCHTLKIALPNKTRLFDYTPSGDTLKGIDSSQVTIWLAPTADEPVDRARKPSKKYVASAKTELIAQKIKDNPDLNFTEIGKLFGISRSRVQQVASRSGITRRKH